MKIALIETDHAISQTVMRSIAGSTGWDLFNVSNAPNLLKYDAIVGYGILRGTAEIFRSHQHWFEIDKGLYDSGHYGGLYRCSYRATQPIYPRGARCLQPVEQPVRPGYTLICPPTDHVCEFFRIDKRMWMDLATPLFGEWLLREKGSENPIDWDNVGSLVTFNSSVGFEALKRGIPVVSDPVHSTIGSYYKNSIQPNLDELLSFCDEHHFTLSNGDKICQIIQSYISGTTPEKRLPQTSWPTVLESERHFNWT